MATTTKNMFQVITDRELARAEAILSAAYETVKSAREALAGADEDNPVTNVELKAAIAARKAAAVADGVACDALAACIQERVEREEDTVSDGQECPGCGEARMDELTWDDAGEEVTCQTCGKVYRPEVGCD